MTAVPSLTTIAITAMEDAGFVPLAPPAVQQATAALNPLPLPPLNGTIVDLRGLLWSSIDNVESRDLDQVEVAEALPGDAIRIRIGIADVDSLVPLGSPIDEWAAHNTSSVYTGVAVFPMLPERISTDLCSLHEACDRFAVVVDLTIDPTGTVTHSAIYRAVIHNHAQLVYEPIGEWLGGGPMPPEVSHVPGLAEQLQLQYQAALRLSERRLAEGALEFESIEARPVMRDGKVVELAVPHKDLARQLIENFMVAANSALATFLEDHGLTAIQRVVRSPERWSRIVDLAARYGETLPATPDRRALARFMRQRRVADPTRFADFCIAVARLLGAGAYLSVAPYSPAAGHFGLAVDDYTHATAPNRRYVDIVVQRLIKAALTVTPSPYTDEALAIIAARCNERQHAARGVERFMRKVVAASWMRERIGDVFEAIVTGATKKGTFVRLRNPPAEGRVVEGDLTALDVGDEVRVRLVSADAERGWIDFAVA